MRSIYNTRLLKRKALLSTNTALNRLKGLYKALKGRLDLIIIMLVGGFEKNTVNPFIFPKSHLDPFYL